MQTIREIGDREALNAAIADAFTGAGISIMHRSVSMQSPEFRRPFSVVELSDGTLKYLCLLAAMLTPRPPTLIRLRQKRARRYNFVRLPTWTFHRSRVTRAPAAAAYPGWFLLPRDPPR